VTYSSYVVDNDEQMVLTSNDVLIYETKTSWSKSGTIALASKWDLNNILAFNVTGELEYSNHTYLFALNEADTTGSRHDSVYAYGYGQYGGSWSKWYGTLDQSYLYYNDGFLGTAQGEIVGITPDSWEQGLVTYSTIAKDNNYNKVLTTEGSTVWYSNSSWSERGFFKTQSMVDVKNVMDWNASALAHYGDNVYLLKIEEKGMTTQYDDDYFSHIVSYVPNDFITMFEGGYGSSGVNEG
jgi:hypothetical protein